MNITRACASKGHNVQMGDCTRSKLPLTKGEWTVISQNVCKLGPSFARKHIFRFIKIQIFANETCDLVVNCITSPTVRPNLHRSASNEKFRFH